MASQDRTVERGEGGIVAAVVGRGKAVDGLTVVGRDGITGILSWPASGENKLQVRAANSMGRKR